MATTLLDMVISSINTAISTNSHAVVDTLTVNLLETLVVFSQIPGKVSGRIMSNVSELRTETRSWISFITITLYNNDVKFKLSTMNYLGGIRATCGITFK